MEYYLMAFKKYAEFNGRSRRKEYWMFALFNMIFSLASGVIASLIGFEMIGSIYSLAVLVPGIAVTVRRLHDIGKSGWMILIAFIPLVGIIWLIVLLATDGNTGENTYGTDPKGNSIGEEALDSNL